MDAVLICEPLSKNEEVFHFLFTLNVDTFTDTPTLIQHLKYLNSEFSVVGNTQLSKLTSNVVIIEVFFQLMKKYEDLDQVIFRSCMRIMLYCHYPRTNFMVGCGYVDYVRDLLKRKGQSDIYIATIGCSTLERIVDIRETYRLYLVESNIHETLKFVQVNPGKIDLLKKLTK